MSLNRETHDAIFGYLRAQVSRYVQESLTGPRSKPFHERLMPPLSKVPFSERSFSTRLGGWFQAIAKMIALQYNVEAESNYLVEGRIRPAAVSYINDITEEMDHGKARRKPNRKSDVSQVSAVQSPGGTAAQVRSDLFVKTSKGQELYFEIKTPDPNKGQCIQMKRDILTIMTLRKGYPAEAYAACGYNPFGEGAPYTANFVSQFLQVGQDILVGREFWKLIGEASTYDELLRISTEVGEAIRPSLPAI
jgi:hypothetical protein